jgi:exodeoxyribonuclease VII large subunit
MAESRAQEPMLSIPAGAELDAAGAPTGSPQGIPGSGLAGPFPVGEYAAALRSKLRSFAHVQLIGELVNLRPSRARVYFELRDVAGAIPCSAWREDWQAMLARAGAAVPEAGQPSLEGMQVVIAGGCDYYPGSATSSPGFSFAVRDLRVAGEGDLLARIERLRKQLDAEGLLELQKRLRIPPLPRTIGVITARTGKARDDVLAALARRGWAGRLVWGFAPVQDRHAAPAIRQALSDIASIGEAEVVIVARGGGSLADLWCFCDETLCRTVAMLRIPVIASVGHHTDRTLLDDVAAASCSTPTHAAEAAVGVDCSRARAEQLAAAQRLRDHSRRAVLSRARLLCALTRAPAAHLDRQRTRLHQQLREMRAGSRRRLLEEQRLTHRRALVLARKAESAARDCRERSASDLERLALALAGHEPQRTLERGYVLVRDSAGRPLSAAAAARRARELSLRFADGNLDARVLER